jgi:uncharacterized membrane protein YphA (DoxX/SURF4 family)
MRISLLTVLLLIVLRLAIGWHFLFEGVQKIHSTLLGPTTTNKPFSSEGYFRETTGPLSAYLRHQIGDPDEMALARLTVVPLPEGKDAKNVALIDRMPPALNQDWETYFQRFADHYQLSDAQYKQARAKFDEAREKLVAWLTDTDVEHGKLVTKTFNASSFEAKQTIPVRIAEYRTKLNELREVYDKKLPLMNRDVEKSNLAKRKSELSQLRASLVSDLDEKTADMKKDLASVLDSEQKEKGRMDEEPQPNLVLKWIDRATVWGLAAIGAGIFFGLFTRLSCLLAAGFLAMTYLAEPSFPWLPVSPKSEGNYVWVNKNVIEMLALLALSTIPTGRWLGLDGLVHWLFSGRSTAKKS